MCGVCDIGFVFLAGSKVSTSSIRVLGNGWASFGGVNLDWSLDLVDLRLWRDKNQIFTVLDLVFNLGGEVNWKIIFVGGKNLNFINCNFIP